MSVCTIFFNLPTYENFKGDCIVLKRIDTNKYARSKYEGESISNQPNLFPVEIHLFFFDVIAL